MPWLFRKVAGYVHENRVSPFDLARFFGKGATMKAVNNYVERRQNTSDSVQKEALRDYLFHIIYRKGTSEYGLMICFKMGLRADYPLGVEEKLMNPDFPIPFSFVYGENDWTRRVDKDFGTNCIEVIKQRFPEERC